MFDDPTFWDILIWSFWLFIWITALMIWFRVIFDVFRDDSLSGWGKAGWTVLLVLLPWLGALIYLIARGKGMGERQMAQIDEARAAQEKYIQSIAGKPSDPAEQIAGAKSLLDSGAITEAEFQALKAKALA